MFEFAWALRYLPDRITENSGHLRRVLLLAFNVIVNVLPSSLFLEEFGATELQDLFDYIVSKYMS